MCRNKNIGHHILKLSLPLLVVFMLSCDRSREDKGYEYFPDMAHGYSYETWSENPAMEDGRTMRRPVEGTVPRHMQPYPYAATFEGRAEAGRELQNPFTRAADVVEEGKALYNIYCTHCHGLLGEGDGWLYTSGKYMIKPVSMLEQRIIDQPSGETYHVISAGWGVMGPHASLLLPEQRWKIVSFIERNFHQKN